MQTKSYSVSSGNRIELWRGIPAEIEISGIENTSGDWLFLIDENWRDGSLLAGTVAASGEKLVVTLEEMNTVELAKAIRSHDSLLCCATLTDGTSRVYLIPITIRNRAIEGTPTPVEQYYTKAEIDEIIAGIQPGGTSDYADLENKPQINSVTLAGNKSAAALGLMNYSGMELATLESSTILAPGKVYAFSPTEAVEMAFPTPIEGSENVFRLRITMPAPAVAVTWPAGLVWRFAIPALAAGTTTELEFAWTGENWEGWAVPDLAEYAKLSGGNTFAGTQTVNGDVSIMSTTSATSRIYMGGGSAYYLTITGDGQRVNFGYAAAAGGNFGSLAVGYRANATGGYGCLSVGQELLNATPSGTVIGKYNVSTTAALVIGGGTSTSARANITVIDWSGNMTLAGDLTFTPTGKAATTLTALEARIAALEAAQN